MTKFFVCAAGKGGTGKTTTAINLAAALKFFGKDVVVVDANISAPNLGVNLGSHNMPINLNHVLSRRTHITKAAYKHDSGIDVIPASLSLSALKKVKFAKLKKAVSDLAGLYDYVIIDCAAGLGKEVIHAMEAGDDIMIITNPELAAVTDALKTIRLAEDLNKNIRGVILSRVREDNLELSIDNIEAMLDQPVIAVIPEDRNILASMVVKQPIVNSHPKSEAAISYKNLAAQLLGLNYNEKALKEQNFFQRLLNKFRP